jgi:hypothetical protein
MKTAAEVAREAAEVVRDRGWTRGAWSDIRGVCAVGGLRIAAFGVPMAGSLSNRPNWEAYLRAKKMLTKVMIEQLASDDYLVVGIIGAGHRGLTVMNDKLVRSGEELAGYMEKAAAKLEENGD